MARQVAPRRRVLAAAAAAVVAAVVVSAAAVGGSPAAAPKKGCHAEHAPAPEPTTTTTGDAAAPTATASPSPMPAADPTDAPERPTYERRLPEEEPSTPTPSPPPAAVSTTPTAYESSTPAAPTDAPAAPPTEPPSTPYTPTEEPSTPTEEPSTAPPTDAPVVPPATETDAPVVPPAVETDAPVVPPAVETDAPVVPPAVETDAPVVPPAVETDAPVVPPAVETDAPVVPPAVETETPVVPPAVETDAPVEPTAAATDAPVKPAVETDTPVTPAVETTAPVVPPAEQTAPPTEPPVMPVSPSTAPPTPDQSTKPSAAAPEATPSDAPPPPATCAAGDKTCKARSPPPAAASASPAPDAAKPGRPYTPPADFTKSVTNKSCSGVIGFVLVDVETGKDLFILREGDIIPKDPLLTIRAVTSPGFDVGDVRFSLAGKFIRTEEYYPYSISGDNTRGSFFPWAGRSALRPGLHKVSATPEFGAGLDVRVKFVDAKTVAFPKDRSLTTFILKRGHPPCGMDVKSISRDPAAEPGMTPNPDPKATPCKKHPGKHGMPMKQDEVGVDMKELKKEVANGDCVVCAKRHSPDFSKRFKVERVCEAIYADAPLWTSPEDGVLFYSDPPKREVLMWNASTGKVTTFWKDSGLVNGLAWGVDGKLLATQRVVGKIVQIDVEDKALPGTAKTTTVVDKHNGKKLSDPNDLVVSEGGDIYFTDPPHYNSTDMSGLSHDAGEVFALFAGDTEPTLIDGTLKRPQGVILDRAEEYLYVSDWQTRSWLRYDVKNGKASGDWNKVVAHQVDEKDRREGRPDGMCIDIQGRVFAAGPGGIWLFGPGFKYEGVIPTPEGAIAVTETALGEVAVPGQAEHEKVLFFTTDEGVYKMSRRALGDKADKLV